MNTFHGSLTSIKYVVKYQNNYIGILNKLKHYLPQNILRILYCSVVQSHLSYAILTWGFDCGRVVKLQRKIIRIIACSRYNAHTEPIFKMLKLLKLRDIFNAIIIKFYYNGCLPSYFNSFRLTSQDQIHTYGTRHNYIIPANVTRTQFAQNCLRNKLPMVIKGALYRIWGGVNRLGDSGVNRLGDTSSFVFPAGQLLLTRRG